MRLPRRWAICRAHAFSPGELGIRRAQDAPRGLDQEPAHPGVAALGDVPPEPVIAGAVLTRHEAEIRLHLVGAVKARDVIERRDEGEGRHRADARHGPQPQNDG